MTDLTPAERKAVAEALDAVRRCVGNNSPSWTGKYGHVRLREAWTEDAVSAFKKLGAKT